WKINKRSDFRAQILGSTSRNFFYHPELDDAPYQTGNGVSWNYEYTFTNKNYNWGVGGDGTSNNFRADVGFTRRTNSMQNYVYFNLNSDPRPKAFVIAKHLGSSFGYRNDFSGRLQGWGWDVNVDINLRGNTSLGGGISIGPEKIYEEEFGAKRSAARQGAFYGAPFRNSFQSGGYAYFNKQFSKRVSISSDFNLGFGSFDYDFGGGLDYPRVSPAALALGQNAPLDPGGGTSIAYDASLALKPTDKFSLSLDYNRSRLKRSDTHLLAFDSNIYSLHTTYQFSRFVNLKARIDYDTLGHRVFGQYTFGWTPSVGKAIYIGYNDNWDYKGFEFGQRQPGLLQLNRTFFIKLSYLIRKSF
ncbi:MAG: hypothetical protein JO314_08865, partial [Acidobacteria bacterium]|nr:hypothetical protein [Acidobacteriota bacterium]